MSNHFSAANLKFPGDDACLDFTDLFVFQSPADPDKTVLIIDANPFLTGGPEFHPDAVHRINIDNDADLQTDVAFSFTFSKPEDGKQTATVRYATGSQARQPEPAGRCRLFIGVRSDPFSADAEGALHGLKWTGQDTFAGKNVLSIALEVPNDMLGGDPGIGAWATISVRRDGTLVQMDRGGHPSVNPIINPDDVKNQYNTGEPATDVEMYLPLWTNVLQAGGAYTAGEATAAARTLLPDILLYDHTRPAAYPNGRGLTDDCFSARMAFLTNGKVTSDGLKPHDDLLAEFPFVGPPNT